MNNALLPVPCSVWETHTARDVFIAALQTFAQGNSREVAITCALAAVWSNARKYQAEQQEVHHD